MGEQSGTEPHRPAPVGPDDLADAFRIIVEGLQDRGLTVSFSRTAPDPIDQLFAHLDRALAHAPPCGPTSCRPKLEVVK